MNILIRTDSSFTIGTGHIMRDLVLAKQYPNDTVIFATQNLEGNINHKIEEANYKIELLNSNNFDELNTIIKKLRIDMIIIDHYGINYHFEKKLKASNPNLTIFVLDDTYEKHHCDILLNHNIYADKKKYKKLVPKDCKIRCGTQYTLLRDEFLKATQLKKKIKKGTKIKTIFVAMGGADTANLNIKLLKVLKEFNYKVFLVTTTSNKNLQKLKEYCHNKKWIKLQINHKNLAKLMVKSDFGIITPSVTANEMHYLEVPFIAIKTAKNQKYMILFLKKKRYPIVKRFAKKSLRKVLDENKWF